MPENKNHSPLFASIAAVLGYFDIFRYPLTVAEIRQFAQTDFLSDRAVAELLGRMQAQGLVYRCGPFWSITDCPEWADARLRHNAAAEAILPVARRRAAFIGRFPYVRAVFASGSLSKNCMADDSDIDFFIITAPGRLWLARTLLVLYKKAFLLNSHKYFCVNYFVDTDHLQIEEQNTYTAMETATLLPLYGASWYTAFQAANGWVRSFFPNFPLRPLDGVPESSTDVLKRALEWLMGGRFGAMLDRQCLRLTLGYWQKKFRHLDQETFAVALKSKTYVSKHHPLFFQKKVLDALKEREALWRAKLHSVEVVGAPDGNDEADGQGRHRDDAGQREQDHFAP